MTVKSKRHHQVDRQLAHVVSHHVRVQALTILAERIASPKEIAATLGENLNTVSHHVKVLREMGLVEIVDEQPRRGATEHFYRAITRPLLSSEEWDKLTVAERQRFSVWIVQLVLGDAAQSFNARLFDARSDRHLSRVPLVLDREGWDEVTEIQNKALKAILEAQAESAERLAKRGAQGFNATAAMMCFEVPASKPGEGQSGPPG